MALLDRTDPRPGALAFTPLRPHAAPRLLPALRTRALQLASPLRAWRGLVASDMNQEQSLKRTDTSIAVLAGPASPLTARVPVYVRAGASKQAVHRAAALQSCWGCSTSRHVSSAGVLTVALQPGLKMVACSQVLVLFVPPLLLGCPACPPRRFPSSILSFFTSR